MLIRSIKRHFSQMKTPSVEDSLGKSQLLTVQNIVATTLRNLYFLQNNLDIVFTTSIILNNDSLRTLRKLTLSNIQQTKSQIIKYHTPPPLLGYIDLESILFRPALALQNSRKYEIGSTLRRIEDNIDERLREMNVAEIEEKDLRRHLIEIREGYHNYSQEYLSQPKPRVYGCVEQNLVSNLFNSVLQKYNKK